MTDKKVQWDDPEQRQLKAARDRLRTAPRELYSLELNQVTGLQQIALIDEIQDLKREYKEKIVRIQIAELLAGQ